MAELSSFGKFGVAFCICFASFTFLEKWQPAVFVTEKGGDLVEGDRVERADEC